MIEPFIPYGRRIADGKNVSVEEVPNGKACDCVCIRCKNHLVAKNRGRKRRPHFSHLASVNAYCDRNLLIHTLAIEAIKRGIERAIEGGTSYPLRWTCPKCDLATTEELARSDTIVRTEKSLVGRTRSDLYVRWGDGGDGTRIIEVVFTHEPSQPTSDRYRKSGIPVVIVKVKTDEDVTPLETGISTSAGINYPLTPCVKCQRWEAARKRARARREERERIFDEQIAQVRAADVRIQERVREFISPMPGVIPRPREWEENLEGYVPSTARDAVRTFQQRLLGLGFVQQNDEQLWSMSKPFSRRTTVYVNYGRKFLDDTPSATVQVDRDSVGAFHIDHFKNYIGDDLNERGVKADSDLPCAACEAWENWMKYAEEDIESILSSSTSGSVAKACVLVLEIGHGRRRGEHA